MNEKITAIHGREIAGHRAETFQTSPASDKRGCFLILKLALFDSYFVKNIFGHNSFRVFHHITVDNSTKR